MTGPAERSYLDADGIEIVYDCWAGAPGGPVIQLLHGIGEHAGRYRLLCAQLAAAGYTVYIADQRGHGRTGIRGGGLGDLGPRGMAGVLDSVRSARRVIDADRPGQPVVLLGHSWGSFLALRLLAEPGGYAAIVLCGSTLRVPGYIADGDLNQGLPDVRTPFDWLSRDRAVVARYLDDPWCGHSSVRGLHPAERRLLDGPPPPGLPAALPVLILAGEYDPVGGSRGTRALADALRDAGTERVTLKLYSGARHELFHELNRAEVITDLLSWLAGATARS